MGQQMEVSAQPYSLHRNQMAFDNPESWIPERWDIPHESKVYVQMKRHFFAFGAGPRMCIGMNVAWTQLRLTLARIYSTYKTKLSSEVLDTKRRPSGALAGATLWPSKEHWPVKFRKLSD